MRLFFWIRQIAISLFLATLLVACNVFSGETTPSLKEQVGDAYESYVLLLESGVNAMITLQLKEDGTLIGKIDRPSESDLQSFFILYTENPLCQDTDDKEQLIDCLVRQIEEKGCVKIATCKTCVYSCD